MKKIFSGLFLLFALTLVSCDDGSIKPVFFDTAAKGDIIKPGKLAVIAGNGTTNEYILAKLVSEKLGEDGRFSIISQDGVTKIIPIYPCGIIDEEPLRFSGGLSEENFSRMNNIQKKIGCDYILLILLDNWYWQGGSGAANFISVNSCAWLIRYPGGKIAGYSYFGNYQVINSFLFDKAYDDARDKLLLRISETLATNIMQKGK